MIELAFRRNDSGAQQICEHLQACDLTFVPPLSMRTNLSDYAAKLTLQAERYEAWQGACLVGLVAVYCNSPDKSSAFVSNVSVAPDFQRRGIARHLLLDAVEYVEQLRFTRICLKVDKRATAALRLYEELGFASARETDMTLTMIKCLEEL